MMSKIPTIFEINRTEQGIPFLEPVFDGAFCIAKDVVSAIAKQQAIIGELVEALKETCYESGCQGGYSKDCSDFMCETGKLLKKVENNG